MSGSSTTTLDARRALVGTEIGAYTLPVERGKVAEFARAVQASDGQGFAPPTFSAAAQHWSTGNHAAALHLDLRRILAGGATWEYHEPVVAGDTLDASVRLVSVEHKESRRGGMTVLVMETSFVNQRGEMAMTWQSTVIELDAGPGGRSER